MSLPRIVEDGLEARRNAIRHLIRTRRIGTQEELRLLLEGEGFRVTQATLSRDLSRIQARRVSLQEGGSVYELEEHRVPEDPSELERAGDLVMGLDSNETLVVVRTRPGAASAVALALDQARLDLLLGTIAGDDTIFLAPARGVRTAKLSKYLTTLWMKGGT